jgi:hypothetical protein
MTSLTGYQSLESLKPPNGSHRSLGGFFVSRSNAAAKPTNAMTRRCIAVLAYSALDLPAHEFATHLS